MSDYYEGRMSHDAQADAVADIIADLEATGGAYCENCLRFEKYCECDKPKIMVYDESIDGYKERKP